MRVAFCASEVVPFAKTGGLADVCGALPIALKKVGVEPVIFLPRYKAIDPKKFKAQKVTDKAWLTHLDEDIPVYLIENKELFDRDGLYGDGKGDYPDNLARFYFYCFESLKLIKELKLSVDVVHTHDWHAALIPVLLRARFSSDPFYRKLKCLQSIHNMAYQGVFPQRLFPKLGIDKKFFSFDGLEFYDQINLLKGGLIFSDRLATVSPQYAKEILTPQFGCGLEGVLKGREDRVVGILNGLDDRFWDPRNDPYLERKYSFDSIENKSFNKTRLQKDCGLKFNKDVPLVGFVARLAHQKGLDLIAQTLDRMIDMDLQIVFLGVGEARYEEILKKAALKHPGKIFCSFSYAEDLAHRIYAGTDLFLMPSLYEPCGLAQMIALGYGTIPIVYKTGGLADTVTHFDPTTKRGNGFVFDSYNETSFLTCVRSAVECYKNKKVFHGLIQRAFTFDFSWERSAREYRKLYDECLS